MRRCIRHLSSWCSPLVYSTHSMAARPGGHTLGCQVTVFIPSTRTVVSGVALFGRMSYSPGCEVQTEERFILDIGRSQRRCRLPLLKNKPESRSFVHAADIIHSRTSDLGCPPATLQHHPATGSPRSSYQ
ncbi:hypothetical protein BC835DRAFT_137968 [Cytidiella melzeri]|nr:hypothetical protein BC835DRAFT_137968 [Cytidiella melzeri]